MCTSSFVDFHQRELLSQEAMKKKKKRGAITLKPSDETSSFWHYSLTDLFYTSLHPYQPLVHLALDTPRKEGKEKLGETLVSTANLSDLNDMTK